MEREQLAREFDFSLPNELNLEEQINLNRNFVGINFVNDGMCADIAIHAKGDGNPHAHVMLTMRHIDQEGEWEHKSEKVKSNKDLKMTIDEYRAENKTKKMQLHDALFGLIIKISS